MNSLLQLEIPKRGNTCSIGGERLDREEDVYSVLYEDEHSKKWARRDFCSACRSKDDSSATGSSRISWKSGGKKKAAPAPTTRIEKVFSLLREFMHSPSEFEREIFVLCLFLARSRQIILRKEFQSEGMMLHLYEAAKQEECFTVKVVDLSTEEVHSIQASLAAKLNVG